MSAAPVIFVGWGSDDRVPGAYGESVFAASALNASDIPLRCVVTGTQLAAGTATPNQDVFPIFSEDDADTFYGAGSEMALGCYAALKVPGANVWGASTAEAPGAQAATATVTISGQWSTTGLWQIWIDGNYLSGVAASTDTPQTVAQNIVREINDRPRLPVMAGAAAGANGAWVVTLTRKSRGARGNDGTLYHDRLKLPTGCTVALAGGNGMSGGGVHFGNGAGVEDITTLLNVLFPGTYDRIAAAQNDPVNAQRWRTQAQTKAGILEGRLEQIVFGATGTLTAAQALAQTSLNEFRCQVVWLQNGECHPLQLAAVMAALRTASEQDNPVAFYDDTVLPGIAPQRIKSDRPQHATLKAALQNSVTPLYSTEDGYVRVSMAITTYSLRGAVPDYRCLQTYYVTLPDYVRRDITLEWSTVIKPNNPGVSDDPASEEPGRPAGMMTPSRTDQWLLSKMLDYAKAGWVIDVIANAPKSGWFKSGKRIHSLVPVVPAPRNHQFGISVRQLAA